MVDMYNMNDTMYRQPCWPMMTCPMIAVQPVQSFMNRMNPMYGVQPVYGYMTNPYFYQVKMKPVTIEEIED